MIVTVFTAALPSDADIYAVIAAAGGTPWINRYDAPAGIWHVDAPSQAALDKAAQDYLANQYPADRLARLKAAKTAALASQRYTIETGGMTLPDGTKVATDRESQGLIARAYTASRDGLASGTVSFKAASGWATMNPAQIKALFQAMTDRQQACYDHEYALEQQIAAATDQAALDAVDIMSGWPG
ncbi:MAG TPA: DUF4376 domain-containing protein [Pirellulales bacterium]|nr:DUF4376 domain-containing protein [Pirellulales bacterium]